nr:hypothetical protein [Tanacetum cinerariifolium]
MTQSGLGVFGATSSSNGINQSSRVLIFGRWATPISSESERCTSSGIGTSSIGYSDVEAEFCLEELEGASPVSHPNHTTLYEALEASMDLKDREEFNEEMAKSHKRCREDQDPPPPPPKDSDRRKKKKHDSNASDSKQPPVQNSSVGRLLTQEKLPPAPLSKILLPHLN